MHEQAVRVLSAQPERVVDVLATIERWAATGAVSESLLAEWRRIALTGQWGVLVDPSEEGDRVRQGSPFVFVLTAHERAET